MKTLHRYQRTCTGLEQFTDANCNHIGQLVETLSSFKVGACQANRLSI